MEKIYETPEVIVVEFENTDLLKLSPGDEGDPIVIDW